MAWRSPAGRAEPVGVGEADACAGRTSITTFCVASATPSLTISDVATPAGRRLPTTLPFWFGSIDPPASS
jgi:hypothetical protein